MCIFAFSSKKNKDFKPYGIIKLNIYAINKNTKYENNLFDTPFEFLTKNGILCELLYNTITQRHEIQIKDKSIREILDTYDFYLSFNIANLSFKYLLRFKIFINTGTEFKQINTIHTIDKQCNTNICYNQNSSSRQFICINSPIVKMASSTSMTSNADLIKTCEIELNSFVKIECGINTLFFSPISKQFNNTNIISMVSSETYELILRINKKLNKKHEHHEDFSKYVSNTEIDIDKIRARINYLVLIINTFVQEYILQIIESIRTVIQDKEIELAIIIKKLDVLKKKLCIEQNLEHILSQNDHKKILIHTIQFNFPSFDKSMEDNYYLIFNDRNYLKIFIEVKQHPGFGWYTSKITKTAELSDPRITLGLTTTPVLPLKESKPASINYSLSAPTIKWTFAPMTTSASSTSSTAITPTTAITPITPLNFVSDKVYCGIPAISPPPVPTTMFNSEKVYCGMPATWLAKPKQPVISPPSESYKLFRSDIEKSDSTKISLVKFIPEELSVATYGGGSISASIYEGDSTSETTTYYNTSHDLFTDSITEYCELIIKFGFNSK